MAISLDAYRTAERRLAAHEASVGLRWHAAVTFVVCLGLVLRHQAEVAHQAELDLSA